jgi:pilus assembly protein Flp/PilA
MPAIRILKRLLADLRGATAVEYGLILALVVLAVLASIQGVAQENTELWAFVREQITTSMGS